MRRYTKYVIWTISAVLFIIFLFSLYQKIGNYSSFNNTLVATDLFHIGYVHYFANAIILFEFVNCYLLLYNKELGLKFSVLLLSIYTLYITVLNFYYIYPSCGCGGIIAQLPFSQHFISNIFLIVLTVVAIILIRKEKKCVNYSY